VLYRGQHLCPPTILFCPDVSRMHAASLAVPDCCTHEIENHWIAAKARPRNIMKNVSTMVQKDLKHIALSLLVRGSAGAQMNHWLLVYT
jgi:hypothetical protein